MSRNSEARKAMLADMKAEMPQTTYLMQYLAWMHAENPKGADSLEADLIDIFSDDKGLRVLKLFEKAVLLRPMPSSADDRALREWSAVRNFVLEIRRIIANGGD